MPTRTPNGSLPADIISEIDQKGLSDLFGEAFLYVANKDTRNYRTNNAETALFRYYIVKNIIFRKIYPKTLANCEKCGIILCIDIYL